jgi:hypothetical protein
LCPPPSFFSDVDEGNIPPSLAELLDKAKERKRDTTKPSSTVDHTLRVIDTALGLMERMNQGEEVARDEVATANDALRQVVANENQRTNGPVDDVLVEKIARPALSTRERAQRWLERNQVSTTKAKLRSFDSARRVNLKERSHRK